MSNTRVRYGRIVIRGRAPIRLGEDYEMRKLQAMNKVPKNTLVTIREGDLVYFGIARCNVNLDIFRKTLGTEIAARRCNLAKDEFNDVTGEAFTLHRSGLRGVAKVDGIKSLLQYFDNIDKYSLDNAAALKTLGV